MFHKNLPAGEYQALLQRETKTYGYYDNEEKYDGLDSSPKIENGSPETANEQSGESENFLKRLLKAPCGDSPKGINCVTLIISVLLTWALLYTLLEQEVLPGGQLFQLLVLAILGYFCGCLLSLIHLPPLLGMLICGIILKNIGFFNMTGIYTEIVIVIREIALTVILLKAGLGLDATALKKLSFVVVRLAFTPCITEAIGSSIATYFIMDMPWLWGLLLGFVLSAVSPAVVVTTLLKLSEQGYGEDKGISTLVIAASSIDDIISISVYGVILGLIFSQGDMVANIIQGPLVVTIGVIVGLGWGFISACIPHRDEKYLILKRSIMVGGGGFVAVLGSQLFGYSGSGPLATIILSFLASLCWKWQGWSNTYNPVSDNFTKLWIFMEPLLFGLIGTDINFSDISTELLIQGFEVLFVGLIIRTITCFAVLQGANLNFKEIIFINLAWLPKATVQAALGPVALDLATKEGRTDAIPYAKTVLTIAVLSILVTAPLGAIGISVGGPRLLSKGNQHKKHKKNKSLDIVSVENHL